MQYIRTSEGTSEEELRDAFFLIKQFPSETTVQLLELFRTLVQFDSNGTISDQWSPLDGCDELYVYLGQAQDGDPQLRVALQIEDDTLTLLAANTDFTVIDTVSEDFRAEIISRCEDGERYG